MKKQQHHITLFCNVALQYMLFWLFMFCIQFIHFKISTFWAISCKKRFKLFIFVVELNFKGVIKLNKSMLSIKSHYFSIASGLCASLASFSGKMINFKLLTDVDDDVSIINSWFMEFLDWSFKNKNKIHAGKLK